MTARTTDAREDLLEKSRHVRDELMLAVGKLNAYIEQLEHQQGSRVDREGTDGAKPT